MYSFDNTDNSYKYESIQHGYEVVVALYRSRLCCDLSHTHLTACRLDKSCGNPHSCAGDLSLTSIMSDLPKSCDTPEKSLTSQIYFNLFL